MYFSSDLHRIYKNESIFCQTIATLAPCLGLFSELIPLSRFRVYFHMQKISTDMVSLCSLQVELSCTSVFKQATIYVALTIETQKHNFLWAFNILFK